jgi:thioredoxin reductase (NADPH)
MSMSDNPPEDVGHAPPVSAETVPAGTADPLPPHLGTREQPVDCAIIGGGPAGLSAAVYLGRLRRSTVVIDDRGGRSLWSQVNRNYLGFPDGVEAAELRRLGREQAARYGTVFYNGRVDGLAEEGNLFRISIRRSPPPRAGDPANIAEDAEQGEALGERQVEHPRDLYARTVIFATGVVDEFPDFLGRDECVGRTLFWCIICDGYEAVDKRVVVVGHDEDAVSTALQLRQFSNTITLVAGQEGFDVPAWRLKDLTAAGIEFFPCAVREYPNEAGCISAVQLDDAADTVLPLDLVFVVCPKHPNSALARDFGIVLDENGYICADSEQKTNRPGVFAAGDVTRLHNHQISSAVHEGGMAAAAANYYMYGALQKTKDALMGSDGQGKGESRPLTESTARPNPSTM